MEYFLWKQCRNEYIALCFCLSSWVYFRVIISLSSLSSVFFTLGFLVSCVCGASCKKKISTMDDLTRKGFGGRNQEKDRDLKPSIVRNVASILRNCHPRSITVMPFLTSVFLWTHRASHHVFEFLNALGDCYR